MMGVMRKPTEVLDYWFGDTRHGTLSAIQDRMRLWFFRASAEFDAIQQENMELIEQLKADAVGFGWDIETDPKALMAMIIVLDQFSRSVHRGNALAFANDEQCAELIARLVLKKRLDANPIDDLNGMSNTWFLDEYSPIERFFLCVALQHSEQLCHQEQGIRAAKLIAINADDEMAEYFRNLKGFPMEHYEVIKRFGKFPHRDILLVKFGSSIEISHKNFIF